MHTLAAHRCTVPGIAKLCELQHGRLELDDIDPLHGRNRRQPAGRAARSEADHERVMRRAMQDGAGERRHDLRSGIGQ